MILPLHSSDETAILSSNNTFNPTDNYDYTLTVSPNGQYIDFYLLKPKGLDDGKDGPLELRVASDCTFTIHLDSHNWRFRNGPSGVEGDAVTIQKGAHGQYWDYARHDDKTVSFKGRRLPYGNGNPVYQDGFNIYVEFLQSSGADPVPVRIDPDVKNPGDPPTLVP